MNEKEDKKLLFEAYLVKKDSKKEFRDKPFKRQDRFVTDTSRFIVAQCSRRAGKSNGLALRFFATLDRYPGSFCPYIALTRESARNIMWPVLQELDERFGVGCVFTESNLTMTHPNGARLQLFGADMKNFIKRLRGIKTPGAGIDEAQDFGEHIQSLVDDVLSPALTDYPDSWLAITGTPGPIPSGYFYEITYGSKYGYSKHNWTLLDNPYLPNASAFIDELKDKRQWDESNPTLLREWRNQWVLDLESLLIKWNEGKNDYDRPPINLTNYVMGIDIGLRDSDAIAVIGYNEYSRDIYLVEEVITEGQDITGLEEQINALRKRYDISKLVIDSGGLGAKLAEEFNRRKAIPVQAADKKRKFENVALLNEWLRLGHFKAKKDSRFVQDSFKVQIDYEKTTPDRLVVKNSFHSDIIDSVLYAFKESHAWTSTAKVVRPPIHSPEWYKQEVDDMESKAIEHFSKNDEMVTSWEW